MKSTERWKTKSVVATAEDSCMPMSIEEAQDPHRRGNTIDFAEHRGALHVVRCAHSGHHSRGSVGEDGQASGHRGAGLRRGVQEQVVDAPVQRQGHDHLAINTAEAVERK
eukprot:CAMPEP_0180564236 /NCGR_PEP_ID=MMETSP1037_2-20121125/4903_1 /TAXON_ID=632150 /ORGANISM="Azadinium spinosum, Strain 3D9" /LENGTH=109 /DNA_ID=CAMNT_0022581123 /DNA_START=211 /DNA_END=541 /DNA_ORIENTATION=+